MNHTQKSYSNHIKSGVYARYLLRIREILLLAFRLLLSTTFMYRWVVVMLLCAMIL